MSDPSMSNSNLLIGRGQKFLKTIKSGTSFLSSSSTFQYEESVRKDKVQYCSPLSVSTKSTATNIRFCKDRGFFKSIATTYNEEQPDYLYAPDTPDSEWADEITPTTAVSDNLMLNIVL